MLANSEDPDEMHAAEWDISSGSTHFAEVKTIILGTEIHHNHNLEKSTCDPLKYTMSSPILIVPIYMGKSIRIQRVNIIL